MSASAIELSGYAALSGATYADFTDLSASGVADALVTQLNFTRTQADDFSTTWEVLSQQSNTLSGFSAALFRNRLTGETVDLHRILTHHLHRILTHPNFH